MKKNVLLLLVIAFFGCNKNLEVIQKRKLSNNNLENYSVDLKQIPDEIVDLFHQGFTNCDLSLPCILEAYSWSEKVRALDSVQYVQYLNYWASYDASKYGIDVDTAKAILFKRINFSQKMFGVMPNKLNDFYVDQVGNAMINAKLPVSMLSWKKWHQQTVDFTSTVGVIITCSNYESVVGYKNLTLQNLKIKHKAWIVLFKEEDYLKIQLSPNSYENEIHMDAGCVGMNGGPDFLLESLIVEQ